MRSGEHLHQRSRRVAEARRINDARLYRPGDFDDGRQRVRFDQLDADGVVVDLAGGQRCVMGDDWDTADSVSVEVPSGAFNLLAGPTYLGGPTRLNGIFTSADSARSLHGVLTIVNESAYG